MSTVFTQHALERMERSTEADRRDVLDAIERISENPKRLAEARNVIRVRSSADDEVFLVQAGAMQAIVRIGSDKPDQIVVMSVNTVQSRAPVAAS